MQKLNPFHSTSKTELQREVYTLSEMAALLGISYATAREAAKSGRMPVTPIRTGRVYLFPKRPVDQILGKCE